MRAWKKGVINPAQMQDKDILFFVSHEHHDHFDPKIFGLDKMGKRVRYVLPEEFDEIFEDGIFCPCQHAGAVGGLPDHHL